jgi:FkbM family methyltransferase
VKKFNDRGFTVEKKADMVSIFNDDIIIKGISNNTLVTACGIFIEECYAFLSKNKFIVYDIGFNIGCAALYFSLCDHIKHIYAFEPFLPTWRQGMANLAANEKLAAKITPFNFGLGGRDEILFRDYNAYASGSMSSVINRFEAKGRVEKIVIKKATDVLRPLFASHSEHIFLKIDCEGAERDIVQNLAHEGLLADVSALVMEWHFTHPKDIVELLKENNFFVFFNHTVPDKLGMIHAFNNHKAF